jgi:hypothetical protein
MGLNLEFLSISNMVDIVYIYQKNGFTVKRENTDQSISVKKRLSGPQHVRVQLHVEEVGNYKNVLYCS